MASLCSAASPMGRLRWLVYIANTQLIYYCYQLWPGRTSLWGLAWSGSWCRPCSAVSILPKCVHPFPTKKLAEHSGPSLDRIWKQAHCCTPAMVVWRSGQGRRLTSTV